jgi:serine/threonine protein phosphatase PrpC
MTWHFTSALNIGNRDEQQDRLTVLHSGNTHLLIVADGMGGQEGGAQAAQTVIDVATRRFSQGISDKPGMFLAMTCLEAHQAIKAQAKGSTSTSGSTCVMVYLQGNVAFCVHVGDSRMYQIRDNNLVFKTSDHSISQLIKKHGGVDTNGPDDQAMQNQLYMCLGGKNEVVPELSATKVEHGDLLLLCSDGFWNQYNEQEMLANMEAGVLDKEKVEQLAGLANQQGQGQSDNISLLCAYWQDTPARKGLLNRLGSYLRGQ